ncbi:MAG: hypothetical protein A1D16_04315 [Flavihumibacter sp. CACIAM 22H1]|nr:MAG: hypothetical protein A1D16_04315 [Flavihumibacter sp. CACIAM 22H1]
MVLLAACGSSKQSAGGHSTPTVKRTKPSKPGDSRFIDGISMTPGEEGPGSVNHPNTGWFGSPAEARATGVYGNIENSTALHFKYAIMLDQPVEYLTNLTLLQFIEDWYGTRYRYGGNTKQGVDCSGFTCNLSTAVFGKNLPRTAREQYDAAQKIPTDYLQEGDLVFFNTRGGVSHVGVYLANNKFVHASTSGGVMISDLNEEYYRKRFVGAGRL